MQKSKSSLLKNVYFQQQSLICRKIYMISKNLRQKSMSCKKNKVSRNHLHLMSLKKTPLSNFTNYYSKRQLPFHVHTKNTKLIKLFPDQAKPQQRKTKTQKPK